MMISSKIKWMMMRKKYDAMGDAECRTAEGHEHTNNGSTIK